MLYLCIRNFLLGFYSTDFANLLGSGTLANKSSVKVSFVYLLICRLTTIAWRIFKMLKPRGTGEFYKARSGKAWVIAQPLDRRAVRPKITLW